MDEDSDFFGMIQSQATMCNFLEKNLFEVMLTRSVDNYDNKGITAQFMDPDVAVIDQIYMIGNSSESYLEDREVLSAIINHPF